jgi:hypothetical protein
MAWARCRLCKASFKDDDYIGAQTQLGQHIRSFHTPEGRGGRGQQALEAFP